MCLILCPDILCPRFWASDSVPRGSVPKREILCLAYFVPRRSCAWSTILCLADFVPREILCQWKTHKMCFQFCAWEILCPEILCLQITILCLGDYVPRDLEPERRFCAPKRARIITTIVCSQKIHVLHCDGGTTMFYLCLILTSILC